MKKAKRIIAWIGIVIIVALVITTFIMGITAHPYALPMLITTMGVSITIWVALWFIQLHSRTQDEAKKGDSESSDE